MKISKQLLSNTPALSQRKFGIKGNTQFPLKVYVLEDKYILCAYQGAKSKLDIVIKYRQLVSSDLDKWSSLRTPSHTHWLIDVLVKRYKNKKQLRRFIITLIRVWNEKIKPFSTGLDRNQKMKSIESLYSAYININSYKNISNYGFYSIKFLFFLATLLMYQERTNYPDGKIFQSLLKKLSEESDDLFSIFSKLRGD